MPEDETTTASEPSTSEPTAEVTPAKKAAAKKAAAKKAPAKKAPAKKAAAKKTAAKTTAKKASKKTAETAETSESAAPAPADTSVGEAEVKPARKVTRSRATKKTADQTSEPTSAQPVESDGAAVLFQVPDAAPKKKAAKKSAKSKAAGTPEADDAPGSGDDTPKESSVEDSEAAEDSDEGDGDQGGARRRRRRGGRRRRKPSDGEGSGSEDGDEDRDQQSETDTSDGGRADGGRSDGGRSDGGRSDGDQQESGEGSSRRRRRRPRRGEDSEGDDSGGTTTRSRRSRTGDDQITAVSGSTRLEAKKQRRREGREAGRRRAPIVSEAEFLARREAVDRVMVIRQREDLTQIGVLEDKVLVEHYVARESQTSMIGNVYLGRVQNVLPSMEAAFIDIGRGRNAVLYAGEVNWSALGHKDGQQRKIESVLSSGQSILVQVSKDPIGHKGARLTSQISLAGRFLVYVPDGTTSGISRKLPDTERNRLKTLLKEIVPDSAGVIVRTAAEGASEEELTRDVERLKARWEDIEKKTKGNAPQLLYGEPDLTLKVVRDLFTEDFGKLVIQGDDAWETVQTYVEHVAPDLGDRLEKYDPADHGGSDVFATYRLDEQIAKGLDRKVWLPSGGSLIIDRTEAMTVVDVNTGKFTGSGGNLEETVTKNNLEAAEEMVRQLRLRDIGGIIVVDFIDMVLESNRDLVLRRLVECLGRDRTRHQVAEVTSLGLVQMTRKRIGTGLIEAFGEPCAHCQGRGLVIHDHPVESRDSEDDGRRGGRRGRGGRGRGAETGNGGGNGGGNGAKAGPPSPKDVAAMARPPAETSDDAVDAVDTVDADEQDELDSFETPQPLPSAEPVENPAEAAEEAAAEALPVEPVETPAAEAPEPEPVAPEKPTVVTRTRRRSASRPAGPPLAVPALDGAGAGPAVNGVVEPGTVSAQHPGEHPGEHGGASGEPGESEDSAAAPQVEHVPIKRKGSRKR